MICSPTTTCDQGFQCCGSEQKGFNCCNIENEVCGSSDLLCYDVNKINLCGDPQNDIFCGHNSSCCGSGVSYLCCESGISCVSSHCVNLHLIWILLGIVAGILAIVGLAVFLYKKKKKSQNQNQQAAYIQKQKQKNITISMQPIDQVPDNQQLKEKLIEKDAINNQQNQQQNQLVIEQQQKLEGIAPNNAPAGIGREIEEQGKANQNENRVNNGPNRNNNNRGKPPPSSQNQDIGNYYNAKTNEQTGREIDLDPGFFID